MSSDGFIDRGHTVKASSTKEVPIGPRAMPIQCFVALARYGARVVFPKD